MPFQHLLKINIFNLYIQYEKIFNNFILKINRKIYRNIEKYIQALPALWINVDKKKAIEIIADPNRKNKKKLTKKFALRKY